MLRVPRTIAHRPAGAVETPATAAPVSPGCMDNDMRAALDEVARTFVEHVRPVITQDVLPLLQRDEALQRRIGEAVGRGHAQAIQPWVALGAIALVYLAYKQATRG